MLRNPLDTQVAKVPPTAMRNLFPGSGALHDATAAAAKGARQAPAADLYDDHQQRPQNH